MMDGGKLPLQPILVSPISDLLRQSTDMLAIDDSEFVAMLRFMNEHVHTGMTVGAVPS